jgi:hypothetical protein
MSNKTYGPVQGKSLDTPVYGGVNNLAREQWAEQYALHTRATNRPTATLVQHATTVLKTVALLAVIATATKLIWWTWFVM